MKEKLIEIFSESGQTSSMRLAMVVGLLCVFAVFVLAAIDWPEGTEIPEIPATVNWLVAVLVGGKVTSKAFEKKT